MLLENVGASHLYVLYMIYMLPNWTKQKKSYSSSVGTKSTTTLGQFSMMVVHMYMRYQWRTCVWNGSIRGQQLNCSAPHKNEQNPSCSYLGFAVTKHCLTLDLRPWPSALISMKPSFSLYFPAVSIPNCCVGNALFWVATCIWVISQMYNEPKDCNKCNGVKKISIIRFI